jgi:hypothetical protein
VFSTLYIPIIAAGAIFLKEMLTGPGLKTAIRIAAFVYRTAAGVLVAPADLPIIPMYSPLAWADKFGFLNRPVKDHAYPKPKIPQEFAMRVVWEGLVQAVARMNNELPPGDKAQAGIWPTDTAQREPLTFQGPNTILLTPRAGTSRTTSGVRESVRGTP